MAVTIYDSIGLMRHLIISDESTDAELLTLNPLQPGEQAITGPLVSKDELNAITGLTPARASPRHAVVAAGGDVVDVVQVDPALDAAPAGHSYVYHETCRIGWRQMRGGSFQRTLAEIEHDIAALEATRTRLNSPAYRAAQAADPDGRSTAQIDAHVAAIGPKIGVLQGEKAARQAPR